jgi:hypothetical protein
MLEIVIGKCCRIEHRFFGGIRSQGFKDERVADGTVAMAAIASRSE